MSKAATLADRIAETVLSNFDSLPLKYKPGKDSHQASNWTILSGIVFEDEHGDVECVALATGMKCLPAAKIPLAKGRVLHDSHAEILALRAFNHFLLHESIALSKNESRESRFLIRTGNSELPLTVRHEIKIHMYCSEAPCGDSSMELIMNKQADPTPWTVIGSDGQLSGRGHFSKLGIVRRKPARADSPETLSKSCSDKLTLKQCTSLLSSHASCLISPENAYLTSMTIPESQYIPKAMERCFGRQGRLAVLNESSWPAPYTFRPFAILTTTKEFCFSRRSIPCIDTIPKVSNTATIWNPLGQEVTINGVLQGRKQTDMNCASMVARSRLAAETSNLAIAGLLDSIRSYAGFKKSHPQFIRRAQVKAKVIEQALVGWIPNTEDDFDIWPLDTVTSKA